MNWKLILGLVSAFIVGFALGKVKVSVRTCPAMRSKRVQEAIRRLQEDNNQSDNYL